MKRQQTYKGLIGNETHLLKESRKHIAMVARITMGLNAVLVILEMPLKLWKMRRQP